MSKSVVLLSGGLDSAANLAFCREYQEAFRGDHEPVLAITVDYGQRAAIQEIQSARRLSAYYGVHHQLVEIRWLGQLGGSSLTDSSQSIPEVQFEQLDDQTASMRSAHQVWVPNRNGVFINIAASFAERLGADRVLVGFNREEAATFPDNSIEFIKRASAALELSTANRVQVFSYTGDLDKREIVRDLRKLRKTFPFELIWSCYRGDPVACGTCESCRRLARALRENG